MDQSWGSLKPALLTWDIFTTGDVGGARSIMHNAHAQTKCTVSICDRLGVAGVCQSSRISGWGV